jgi:hypothetical protein
MMPLLTGIAAFVLYMISPFSSSLFLHVLAVNDHFHLANAKSSLPLFPYCYGDFPPTHCYVYRVDAEVHVFLRGGVFLFSAHVPSLLCYGMA